MDFTTIIGIIAGLGLVIYGIGVKDMGNFVDIPSVYITIGGSIAMVVASFPFRVLKDVPKHFKIAFFGKPLNPVEYINKIVELAQLARRNGLLALEEKANQESDPFLKGSLLLIVDAIDAEKIRQMLDRKINNLHARHEEGISVYEKGAAFGPAFGMIGTLIGLINMLKNLDLRAGASDSLGEGMSIALITTFYGSMLANVICLPIAGKLKIKHDEEILCKEIILEGVLSIQSGENPKYIKEKLTSFLTQRMQEMDDHGGGKNKKGKGKKAEA